MMRTSVRDKANLVVESGDWVRRMQKSLDQMNVRWRSCATDAAAKSSRRLPNN
jgi:hypothetical protein